MRSCTVIMHPKLRPFRATVAVPGKPETECTYLLLAVSEQEAKQVVELTKDFNEELVSLQPIEVGTPHK